MSPGPAWRSAQEETELFEFLRLEREISAGPQNEPFDKFAQRHNIQTPKLSPQWSAAHEEAHDAYELPPPTSPTPDVAEPSAPAQPNLDASAEIGRRLTSLDAELRKLRRQQEELDAARDRQRAAEREFKKTRKRRTAELEKTLRQREADADAALSARRAKLDQREAALRDAQAAVDAQRQELQAKAQKGLKTRREHDRLRGELADARAAAKKREAHLSLQNETLRRKVDDLSAQVRELTDALKRKDALAAAAQPVQSAQPVLSTQPAQPMRKPRSAALEESRAAQLKADNTRKPRTSGTIGTRVNVAAAAEEPFEAVEQLLAQLKDDERAFVEGQPLADTITTSSRVDKRFRNGARQIEFPNGTSKLNLPGSNITNVRFANGDVKRIYPNGNVVYFYADVGTLVTTLGADGTKVFRFPNKQVERHFTDGRKEVFYPDGTRKYVAADGTERAVFPDGTVQNIGRDNARAGRR